MFPDALRWRSSAPAPAAAAPAAPTVPPAGETLETALRRIVADAAAPEDALEPTLRAILEATGASAGAVCLYDPRREVLRLAAEVGLSDEGCRRLRTVRRAEVTSWDMPLHSLFNRRVYLIESAAQNRYVPPLVEHAASVRTVACLPLYEGSTPLGSLVLIMLAPQSLTERHVRVLEQPLREVTRLIGAVRSRASAMPGSARAAAPPPPSPAPPPPVPDGEAERLRATLEAAAGEGARLSAELEGVRAEAERATALAASLASIQQERVALGVSLEATRAELVEARAVAAARGEETVRAQADLERLQADATVTRERLERLVTDAEAREGAARTRLAEQEHVVEALRAAALDDEVERLRAALEAAGGENARQAAELESVGVEAARATSLAASLAVVEGERETLTAALEATRAELAEVRAAAGGRADEIVDAQQALEHLGGEVADGHAAREQLVAEAEAREREMAGRLEEYAREVETLRAAHEEEKAATASRLETLTVEVEQLREALADAEAERDRLAADVGSEVAVIEMPVDPPVADEPLAAPVAPPEAATPPALANDGPRSIVVLDAEAAWEQVTVDAHRVVVVPAGEDVAPQVAAMAPARIVVNLLRPGALDALAALRAGGCTTRFWGCLADPSTGRALPLGMIEPTVRPLELDAILAAIEPYVARGTRVVTIGTDVDVLVSLRQALARQGVSVSMAWDAKQAADLLTMVRPELVVLDLGLPLNEGYRILARLGAAERVPSTVVMPGGDPDAGFAAALADPEHARRLVPLDQLLGSVLARSEKRPVERR